MMIMIAVYRRTYSVIEASVKGIDSNNGIK